MFAERPDTVASGATPFRGYITIVIADCQAASGRVRTFGVIPEGYAAAS